MIEENFMVVFSKLMNGVWLLFDTPLHMPQPIGTVTSGEILLFFACGYLLADTISMVSERRD